MEEFDYIIAGGGSAGCVLAARLSEDPSTKVLLIEAGGESGGFLVNMPAGSFALMGGKKDWRYQTEPDPSVRNRRLQWAGGKVLGGSSSINGMVYIRGDRRDYDDWVKAGAKGWSFDENMPYFKRSEHFNGAPSQSHGMTGPLQVSESIFHPLGETFIEACNQVGIERNPDYCAGDQSGVFRILSTTGKGQRYSTERAYLAPARSRANLKVVTNALVDRVIVENRKATGIRVLVGGQTTEYMARGEVLICAGSIGSPAILLRSGIGPAEDIKAHGIELMLDLPGVGGNLQEHTSIGISKLVDVPTYNSPFGPYTLACNLVQYVLHRNGPMTSAAVHVMAYARSRPELEWPDVAINFLPLAIDMSGTKPKMHDKPGVYIVAQTIRPDSRGRIRLRSADPNDLPRIEHRQLGDPRDMDRLVFGGKLVAAVFDAPALKVHVTGENAPSPIPASDEEWRDYILDWSKIGYHPVGTCAMGEGAQAVLDADLRVRGIDRLRVIDASAMPNIISGNTNAPTIMIAERAAAKLNGEQGA